MLKRAITTLFYYKPILRDSESQRGNQKGGESVKKKDIRESEVEGHLRRSVESTGGQCVKFLPDYKRGWPDRILLLPGGALVWVETKRPVGGKLSAAQLVAHELLRRMGQRVEMVWTKEEADRLVESLIQEKPTS